MTRFIQKGVLIFFCTFPLHGEDLWNDHNPYHPLAQMGPGAVLKLVVDEPIQIEYEYEKSSDERSQIKMVPEKNLMDFIPAASSEKSIVGNGKVKIRSRGRLRFRTGVRVDGAIENGVLRFVANRYIGYEEGKARQAITISGSVHINDVSNDRVIHSSDVSDLVIRITGFPVPQKKELQLKMIPPTEEGGEPTPSAKPSEEERQRMLLDYLNRILGESLNE